LAIDADLQVLEIREGGAVWGWRENFFGEVGEGTKRIPVTPVPLSGPFDARCVAAGDSFSLAVDGTGAVWQWGYWEVEVEVAPGVWASRSIGSTTPKLVPDLHDIVLVAAGEDHALALDDRGRVWAWGSNVEGQLGDGSRRDRARDPVRVKSLPKIRDIAAGWGSSLALDETGAVWAWGKSYLDGSEDPGVPFEVQGLPSIRDIDARGMHLALGDDGSVWSWGQNNDGQLGDGTTIDRTSPVRVAGLDGVVAVDAGAFHAVALRDDGAVWSWGFNSAGEVGDGTSTGRSVPVKVPGLVKIQSVAAGTFLSLAVGEDGSLWAWGSYSLLEPGPVGWRNESHGVYPSLALREFAPGHVRFIVRPVGMLDVDTKALRSR